MEKKNMKHNVEGMDQGVIATEKSVPTNHAL
jgi:hypothetical protein